MKYKGYFDGSSKGNPGLSHCSWYVEDENKKVIERGVLKAKINRTNNVSEYMGLIELFKYLIVAPNITHIEIFGDSKLVVEQVNGNWNCKSENIKPYYTHAVKLFEYLSSKMYMTLSWVPRSENQKADNLAQKGIL